MTFSIRHLPARLGLVLALILTTVVLMPSQPAAADTPSGWYQLRSVYSAKCMEGDLAHISDNGDQAQLWDCWNDPGNQKWYLYPLGNNTYKLINLQSGKCLESDLSHSGNGTKVQLWDCWNDPGNQQWHIYTSPFYQQGSQLVNVLSGMCLDADLAHMTTNGTRLQLWDCWNDPGNDHFQITPIPNP